MSKKAILVGSFAALAAVLLATAGNRQYRIRVLKATLQQTIDKDAGYTEGVLKEPDSSKKPLQEFRDLCNKSIQARTRLVDDLRGGSGFAFAPREKLIELLNAENDLVQTKSECYRKHREMLEQFDHWTKKAGFVGMEALITGRGTVSKEVFVAGEAYVEAARSFLDQYQKAVALEKGLADAVSGLGIRPPTAVQQHEKANKDNIASDLMAVAIVLGAKPK